MYVAMYHRHMARMVRKQVYIEERPQTGRDRTREELYLTTTTM